MNAKLSSLSYLILFSAMVTFAPSFIKAESFALSCPNGNSPKNSTALQAVVRRTYSAGTSSFGQAKKLYPLGRTSSNKAVQCALGDLNGDGVPEIITAQGKGLTPIIKIFNGATLKKLSGSLGSFLAFEKSFRGGVNVAVGDVNGDGTPDIVTGVGTGSSRVRVFNGSSGELITSFSAYDTPFKGGVRVAAGDIDGDGFAEIVTGPGPGTDSAIKIFNGQTGEIFQSFLAFDTAKRGVYVAIGEVNGDGRLDIIVGPGAGSAGLAVKVFNEFSTSEITSFFPYNSSFKGGVLVSAADLNSDGKVEIITGPASKGNSNVRVFNGTDQSLLTSFRAYPTPYSGGVAVGLSTSP